MIKGFIKIISYVQLVLGIIGSFIIAYFRGKIPEDSIYYSRHHQRSIGMTIGSFLVSLFSVLILFAFLYGFYIILENQELILYRLHRLVSDNSSCDEGKDSYNNLYKSGFRLKKLDDKEREPNPGEWKCSFCGRINSSHKSLCICRTPKPL